MTTKFTIKCPSCSTEHECHVNGKMSVGSRGEIWRDKESGGCGRSIKFLVVPNSSDTQH
jgi:hypothetical protein